MTDNKQRVPPTLIEPDSDDEGPRKRRRIDDEGSSSTTEDGLAILKAALMVVVAAELRSDQNLSFNYGGSSHQISYMRNDQTVQITSEVSNRPQDPVETTNSTLSSLLPLPRRFTKPRDPMIPSQLNNETSHLSIGTKGRIPNMQAPGVTRNSMTTKGCSLPSGRPLLAPPRLPTVKCGERLTTGPSSKLGA